MDENRKSLIVWLMVLCMVLIALGALFLTMPQFVGIEAVTFTTSSTSTTSFPTTVTGVLAVNTTPKTGKPTTTKENKTDATQVSVDFPLNINAATKEELMCVSGIGETYAQRIIDYRDTIGGYVSLEQLLEVDGIGEKRLSSWAPFLTVA